MTSSWDGHSRAPLRVGLALRATLTLVALARAVAALRPGALSHPDAPAWLLGLGDNSLALGLVAAVGVAAALAFALDRAPLVGGALLLAALALLAEPQAAIGDGPRRAGFAAGAMLLGWLVGLAWGRALGARRREELAEAGAVATLAATYVWAAASKLLSEGLGWMRPATLTGTLLSLHRVDDASLASRALDALVRHPALASGLLVATLLAQLGAVALTLGPRWRAASATLLIGFHLAVRVFTGIDYGDNLTLLALFGYPWAKLSSRWVPAAPLPPADSPLVARRVLVAALVLGATVLALAWLLPLRAYTLVYDAAD
jgi:hypothetical protein